MGKTIFLMFLNVLKENFNSFYPKKTSCMDFTSAQKPPCIYIEKCSGIKKYGTAMILEVDDIIAD